MGQCTWEAEKVQVSGESWVEGSFVVMVGSLDFVQIMMKI
jgi:hypothetical protein